LLQGLFIDDGKLKVRDGFELYEPSRPEVNQTDGREGYRGERKCVQCQQQATQVRTQPVFKLESLGPKTAQRGLLNLDVQIDTDIRIHGRPKTFGRPGQVNNLAHLKTDIL
jgi:hypothetical protein